MPDERKLELFDEALAWVFDQTEHYGCYEVVSAYHQIGLMPDEIEDYLIGAYEEDELQECIEDIFEEE